MALEGENALDLIQRLPFDIVVIVASHLGIKDLYSCWQVSRHWHRLFTDDSILYPVFLQLSHFDQESFLYQCLPNSGHHPKEEEPAKDERNAEGVTEEITADLERLRMEETMRMEDRASQQWLKDRRVLMRVLQNLLNRNQRWQSGEPTTRIYLPPVPLDGTDSDIKEEWQGAVKMVKMKCGTVAVLYEAGKSIRLWNLASEYNQIRAMTTQYVEENREALEAQTKGGGPLLPPFSDQQVEAMLKCTRSGVPRQPLLSVLHLKHEKPAYFDFFSSNQTLVTATVDGYVDIYDLKTRKHRRTLRLSTTEEVIQSIHVWLNFVIVSHGSRVTLWDHTTGEVLEDGLQTAHEDGITGVFILDNDKHLLSIDKRGVLVVTDRGTGEPTENTLLDVPLYPLIMGGQLGAPYSMRLLHMTHLCVWGKHSIGHYELYEPGLRNLPPIGSLIIAPSGDPGQQGEDDGWQTDDGSWASGDDDDHAPPEPADRPAQDDAPQAQPETAREAAVAEAETDERKQGSTQDQSEEERRESDARAALAQLEASHRSLEHMYNEMAGDRDNVRPDGSRMERLRNNRIPVEDRYHVLNIETSFENIADGHVLSVDFRHALFQRGSFMHIHDLEQRMEMGDEEPKGPTLGIFPVDGPPQPRRSHAAQPRAAPAPESGEEKPDYFFEWAASEDLGRMAAGSGQNEPPNPERLQRPLPTLEGSNLVQLEALTMRYVLGLRFANDDSGFGRVPYNLEQLRRGRAFVTKYMPELMEVIELGPDNIDALAHAARYHVQRAYEAGHFRRPVLNVDHHGQCVGAEKICRDMDRTYRASKVAGDEVWRAEMRRAGGKLANMPLAVCHLRTTAAAMDDGQIAVGCQNGFVVVSTFD
ncbi:hypothetical protein GGF46_001966 [Coemansia sp. RSA 552]|nr:hypothetical protein GGF46_001966 [Coemansia sp. RSA 552]